MYAVPYPEKTFRLFRPVAFDGAIDRLNYHFTCNSMYAVPYLDKLFNLFHPVAFDGAIDRLNYHFTVCVIVWREVMFVYLLVVLPGYPARDN
ncbi:hypothetical protein WR25_07231 [Diploscapter pachys]|uniref:Uncharacterized protein n=1 Tax=Diploscapter pachys TaxID=2018661 RepID=A0A2A2L6V7_9BILA|nr:hypothetical protein WR25_07231 [Diploscapter pachys]